MLHINTTARTCEVCYREYVGTVHDESQCPQCRRTLALERIADVLEHWVGIQ
jgi:ribosomal protein L37AE/L43A